LNVWAPSGRAGRQEVGRVLAKEFGHAYPPYDKKSSSGESVNPRRHVSERASRSAPALEPSEGEQDERYDERTDRVLDGDVSGARLEPREKRGKATRWNEPVHGGDGKEQDAKKSGDQRQGRFIGRMYTRTANFPLRLPP
jgi:hypothetical protein